MFVIINPVYDKLDGMIFSYGNNAFTGCIVVTLAILSCTTNAIFHHISFVKKENVSNKYVIFNLVMSFICCILLIFRLNFQFSNISMYYDLSLFYKTIAVCVLGFILFIIQIILLLVRKFFYK